MTQAIQLHVRWVLSNYPQGEFLLAEGGEY